MLRSVLLTASAATVMLAAAPALAQVGAQTPAPAAGAYGTLGYGHFDAQDAGLGTIQGRLGYKFTPNLGVEGEGAFGVDTDRATVGGVGYDAKVKRSIAAYGVGTVPLSDRFEIFGRLGYGNTKMKASLPGTAFSGDADADSVNYGVGGQYFFDGKNGLRADWTRHDFRHNQGHADVYGVSYVRRF